jgi:tol-pal system protein YbgF
MMLSGFQESSMLMPFKTFRSSLALVALVSACAGASAGLFDDEEARKAILDLRQKVEAMRLETDQKLTEQTRRSTERAAEDTAQVRRSLLELQNQIESLRSEMANLRGQNEQLTRDSQLLMRQLADVQRQQKDAAVALEDRVRKFEPSKVTVDGKEFLADPAEKRDFEAALAIFRKGEFAVAQPVFVDFVKRYPLSGYAPSALFWLGNAQYATRDYKEAMVNFRSLLAQAPDHLRAPEAVLSIANCQIELKDTRGARKTLEDLGKAYPQSEAAVAGKERLARLR